MTLPKIIIICGPTGAGKTGGAIKLAEIFSGEIINADSMQIYKYMDIGTAKPDKKELASMKHHMIDIIEPDEDFNAALYSEKAGNIANNLYKNNITPFVVGGTGLYIKALIYGMFKDASDDKIKKDLKNEMDKIGVNRMHERLMQIDPEAALKINKNDSFRILRALGVYETTGKKISEHHKKHEFKKKYFNALKIGITEERNILYERINNRADMMIKNGFIEEVESLLKRGYSENLKSMQSLGYRHICLFLQGKLSKNDALEEMKKDTRRYAKRQLTWFKKDTDTIWTTPDNLLNLTDRISRFLQEE